MVRGVRGSIERELNASRCRGRAEDLCHVGRRGPATKGQLQIIVLDHATDTVWGDVDGLTIAAQWRDGAKLVPDNWPAVGA